MDYLKRQYGKLSTNELTRCFQPNPMQNVCKEDMPILLYVPGNDCDPLYFIPHRKVFLSPVKLEC
jgi:hypothetical protein